MCREGTEYLCGAHGDEHGSTLLFVSDDNILTSSSVQWTVS